MRETAKSAEKILFNSGMSGAAPERKVYVVDDDPGVRSSLLVLFRSVGMAVATFPTSQSFFEQPLEDVASCLILDLNLPGPNGLDLQDKLRQEGREIPIIFITGYGNVPASVRAMKAGAVDFIEKPFTEEALLNAVTSAIAHDEKARAERRKLAVIQKRFERLTPRERQVMALVVQGLLNKQIAADLGTAEQTIKIHRGRVMSKMQAQSVPDLVHMAENLQKAPANATLP